MKNTIYVLLTGTIHSWLINQRLFLPAVFLAMFTCIAVNGNAQNTRFGTGALPSNSGSNNTALGYFSMNANTTGSNNTATGSYSLRNNTTGVYNTASGHNSLYSNSTGTRNTVSGWNAMYFNTTGSYNTASGLRAMETNTIGNYNTATGAYGLLSNTTGSFNTAVGHQSLIFNTKGQYNTACGVFSLYHNTTGNSNKADGYQALYNNTTGSFNTGIGRNALYSNTTGNYNTAVGYNANVLTGTLTNATAIGNGAMVNASNKVRIGNTSVTSIGGQVGWSIFSDGRFKKDIKENVQGLAFIKNLRPVTYTVNAKGLNEYYNKERKQNADKENQASSEELAAEDAAGKIVYNGFIAQEVEEAAKKLNFEFSGVDKPQSKDGLYGLRYDNFIVPLVKAVQELSKMNDEKGAKIDELRKRIERLESMNDMHSANASRASKTISINEASLEQNVPNPFINTTTIHYLLPQKFTTARVLIADKNGRTLKQVNISGSGKGMVNIDAASLSSGTYNYSLVIDGRVISSKQMILKK